MIKSHYKGACILEWEESLWSSFKDSTLGRNSKISSEISIQELALEPSAKPMAPKRKDNGEPSKPWRLIPCFLLYFLMIWNQQQ